MRENSVFFLNEIKHDFNLHRLSLAASVLCIALLLLFLALLTGVGIEIRGLADALNREAQITLFLKEDLPASDTEQILKSLSKMEGVGEVRLVSKQEALDRMSVIFGGQKDSLSAFEGYNPFLSFLEVKVVPEKGAEIAENAASLPGVDWIRDNRETLAKLFRLTKALRVVESVTIALVGIIIMIVVAHIINLGLAGRKIEMEVYRLLGATELFIGTPFIMEGAIMGLCGGITAVTAALILFPLVFSTLQVSFPFLPLFSGWQITALTAPWLLAAGCFFGTLGSLVALRQK